LPPDKANFSPELPHVNLISCSSNYKVKVKKIVEIKLD
jgi:hypothetical protein